MINIKLYKGEALDLLRSLPDKSIDFICADLPYGSTKNIWDIVIPFDPMWKELKRICKRHGAIALFGSGLFAHKLALSNEKEYKYEIIWAKSKSGSSFTAKYRPVQKHEHILIFGKGKVQYTPQMEEGEPYYRKRNANMGDKPNNHKLGLVSVSETINEGYRYPTTVQFFQQKWRRQDQLHPTQKPVPLIEWLIRSYSKENDIVLDFVFGSGTTAEACFNTSRNFIGSEQSIEHFQTAQTRLTSRNIPFILL